VEARELKLIPGERDRPARGGPWRATPAVLGLFVVGAALGATWLGADEARRTIEVRELAEDALQTALQRGSADRDVRDALVDLRRTLGWRPLESKTRVIYASLVLGLATRLDDMRLAEFHAGRASELSPVTVSIVRASALVLANTGDPDRALRLVRRMFGYDAPRAAKTLAQIESLVLGVRAWRPRPSPGAIGRRWRPCCPPADPCPTSPRPRCCSSGARTWRCVTKTRIRRLRTPRPHCVIRIRVRFARWPGISSSGWGT
jgi:hypothetical protein